MKLSPHQCTYASRQELFVRSFGFIAALLVPRQTDFLCVCTGCPNHVVTTMINCTFKERNEYPCHGVHCHLPVKPMD